MPAVLDGKLKSANEIIGKGFPITLQNGRAFLHTDPSVMTLDEIVEELRHRPYLNVSIMLKGSPYCAVDCDSEAAVEEARKRGLLNTCLIRTRRGIHALFRHEKTSPKNFLKFMRDTDVIFNNAIPAPPSVVNGVERRWLTPVPAADDLPLLPSWVQPVAKPTTIFPLVSKNRETLVKYIEKIEAHQGSGGHGQAFRCACKIASQVEDIREGLAIFLTWNESNAMPPFSERECIHKIEDAYRKTRS